MMMKHIYPVVPSLLYFHPLSMSLCSHSVLLRVSSSLLSIQLPAHWLTARAWDNGGEREREHKTGRQKWLQFFHVCVCVWWYKALENSFLAPFFLNRINPETWLSSIGCHKLSLSLLPLPVQWLAWAELFTYQRCSLLNSLRCTF